MRKKINKNQIYRVNQFLNLNLNQILKIKRAFIKKKIKKIMQFFKFL